MQGKVAMTTGAAMSIGLACAQTFAKEGAVSVLVDIDIERAKQEAAKLVAEGLKRSRISAT